MYEFIIEKILSTDIKTSDIFLVTFAKPQQHLNFLHVL